MQLNRSNELVQSVFAFVGASVEKVRRTLVEEERKRRQTQEARRLNREAEEIARLINEDFDNIRARIEKVRSRKRGGRDLLDEVTDASERERIYILGDEEPVVGVQDVVGGNGDGNAPSPGPAADIRAG